MNFLLQSIAHFTTLLSLSLHPNHIYIVFHSYIFFHAFIESIQLSYSHFRLVIAFKCIHENKSSNEMCNKMKPFLFVSCCNSFCIRFRFTHSLILHFQAHFHSHHLSESFSIASQLFHQLTDFSSSIKSPMLFRLMELLEFFVIFSLIATNLHMLFWTVFVGHPIL